MKIYLKNIFKIKKNDEEYKDSSIDEIKVKTSTSKSNNVRKGANNIKKEKIKINKHNLPKSYYVLLFFMISLAGLSVKLVNNSKNYALEENYAVFNSTDYNLESEIEVESNNSNQTNFQDKESGNIDAREKLESEVSSVSSSNVVNVIQDKVEQVVQKKVEPIVFAKPIKGEILKIFSDDKVIYSKTLEMWKTHDGIDIKGQIGDIVYSAERGTVEKVYEDAFYGITIVINHGQGYKTSYSNLSEDVFVEEGDTIKKSQKIGKIGSTAIGEIKDDAHLHFMLYENNVIADPSSIFE